MRGDAARKGAAAAERPPGTRPLHERRDGASLGTGRLATPPPGRQTPTGPAPPFSAPGS